MDTGKKERYDAMTDTDIQGFQSSDPRCTLVPQLRTNGASATSGTVWLSTIHGSRPRSTTRNRAISSARTAPATSPSTSPCAAMASVVILAATTAAPTVGLPGAALTGSKSCAKVVQTWGIESSPVRGSTLVPAARPPAAGPPVL